jgi:UTP--glucose-1-phosphate uridylyltransferase
LEFSRPTYFVMSNQYRIVKAVIPASGLGTRMLPATKAIPKEMLPVAGKPLIQYAVEEAAASGIESVVIVIRNKNSPIRAHFAPDPALEAFLEEHELELVAQLLRRLTKLVNLQYVEQEKPLGLAHAIGCAQPLLGEEPFVVLLPDVIMVGNREPVTRQLIRTHEQSGGSLVAIRKIALEEVERHGIVQVEDNKPLLPGSSARVVGLVEKPPAAEARSLLGVCGRYLLQPEVWSSIAQTKPDARGEVQITDALNLFCKANLFRGLCFEGLHYDAGDRAGYLKANVELSLQDPNLSGPLREYFAVPLV